MFCIHHELYEYWEKSSCVVWNNNILSLPGRTSAAPPLPSQPVSSRLRWQHDYPGNSSNFNMLVKAYNPISLSAVYMTSQGLHLWIAHSVSGILRFLHSLHIPSLQILYVFIIWIFCKTDVTTKVKCEIWIVYISHF